MCGIGEWHSLTGSEIDRRGALRPPRLHIAFGLVFSARSVSYNCAPVWVPETVLQQADAMHGLSIVAAQAQRLTPNESSFHRRRIREKILRNQQQKVDGPSRSSILTAQSRYRPSNIAAMSAVEGIERAQTLAVPLSEAPQPQAGPSKPRRRFVGTSNSKAPIRRVANQIPDEILNDAKLNAAIAGMSPTRGLCSRGTSYKNGWSGSWVHAASAASLPGLTTSQSTASRALIDSSTGQL